MKKDRDEKVYPSLQQVTAELIAQNYVAYQVRTDELTRKVIEFAQAHGEEAPKKGSILPSDFCYNRVNKGISFEDKLHRNRLLFAYVSRGVYACLGENYLYDGPVFTQPKGAKNETVVGNWNQGKFTPNENWDKFFSK